MAAVAATLGIVEQTLYNWVKADREGELAGAGMKPVSAEQMELARLCAEVARLTHRAGQAAPKPRERRRTACADEVIDWLGFYNARRLHSTTSSA
jgi:transposase-like protein